KQSYSALAIAGYVNRTQRTVPPYYSWRVNAQMKSWLRYTHGWHISINLWGFVRMGRMNGGFGIGARDNQR
ncbi:hypothetical protein, partial [Pseudomonas syringae]|uniref:hypothetical protein n=1 Tax=Pseudomonas syringae TaxID=317 RepID=UPI001C803D9F